MSTYGLAFLLVVACFAAGCQTDADLIIVQLDSHGRPTSCWELEGAELTDMQDPGYTTWRDERANIICVRNPSRHVRVFRDDWDGAFATQGLARGMCRTLRNHRVQLPAIEIPNNNSEEE
jgi:hypothetical protein